MRGMTTLTQRNAGHPDDLHVVPLDDLREHEASPDCWCKPVALDYDRIWVHPSMDRREHTKERGILH